MAESPATTSTAMLERDGLLATKLYLPRPRPGLVPRPRLLEHLDQGMARELVLVCTPAGFGKTTLLGDWAQHQRRPVGWLSLDEADNDPARFWRHVATALDRVHPGVAGRVDALLRGLQPASLEAVVTTLVNQLAGVAEEVVLVLDDYHLIDAPPVHASLGLLLEHQPPCLHVVLTSRADPPLPLARLRGRGQLAELRAAELRFTPQEAAALLRAAVGPDLPQAAVVALVERTEGWAAGLQLAALSLRGHADPAGFTATFSGTHRYVLDYLAEEVLDRQPEPLRSFLLETSVLERLSGPLCAAVTGRADSQQLLEEIERANLFLVPLDEVRGWWRYHQLFADLLRARLQRERPERVAGLHRSAGAWSEQHGLVDEAVRHALAAEDAVWAARLIERHFDEVLRRSEDATLRRWLKELPSELVRSRPRLCLAQAFGALISGHVEAVEPLLAGAERGLAAIADEPYEPSVGRAASLLTNVPAAIAHERATLAHLRGDAEGTITFARRALAELDEGEWMLDCLTRWHLGGAEWLRGRLAEAERALVSSIAGWRAAGDPILAAWSSEHLGQVQRAQGRLDAALGTYREALEMAAEPGGPALQAAGPALVGMAAVLYERGELEAALGHASEGIALCRQLGYSLPLVGGLATLARLRQAEGDRAAALAAITEAERVGLSPAVVALLNPVPALRARLALAHGQVADAARWAKQRGLAPDDHPSYPREAEYLVLARVLFAQHTPGRALGLLERLHGLAVAQGRVASVIEILALQALARAAAGDERGALAALAEALTLAAPEGYLRVFVDEGAPMAALLGRLAAAQRAGRVAVVRGVPPDYLDRLTDAFAHQGASIDQPRGRIAAAPPGLVAPLSARELEVLGLLAAGRSNQAIAEELVITLDTVKRHVTHLLDKLGAANRTQAVTRAQELRLLR
jgi:LuxR family transcriptional regulator, maltose regulon positive regulatory protein